MSSADLELLLFRQGGEPHDPLYGLRLRFRPAASNADTLYSSAAPLRFDLAGLRARRNGDYAAYGAYLAGQLLAEAGARSFFEQARAVALAQGAALHIRLFLDPGALALHDLLWETLRLPGADAPLLTGETIRFSRYLSARHAGVVDTPSAADVRALVAVAAPKDSARYRLAEVRVLDELQAARAGLGDILADELAAPQPVTLNRLLDRLRDGYGLLYLVAHGILVDGEPQVLLEDEDGAGRWVSGVELAARIGELRDQQRPRLVVLVSCQSAGTGESDAAGLDGGALAGLGPRLAAAGVPAVVAMQGNLSMATAAQFMPAFLRELRRDGVVDRAVAVARGAVRERPDWWMPVLFTRLEDGRLFELPSTAADPLYVLPPLPQLDLPDKPYHYLDWYRREDAEIFFGRGREIRDLYDRVTAEDSEPIVLLYGQSGVGKSSLLAAGLLPRLEASHVIRYTRRDQAIGLLGTLAAALAAAPDDDLASAWHKMETQSSKPLLVVLDQVEEFFTRPNPEQPGELANFLDALERTFADSSRRPRGRLILGFRKEWLAEIDKRLIERKLPRAGVFLERLGRAGIAEVVAGPTSRPRLRARYGLTVADALPGLLADDLLADRESPVAPMLAILLTDMWAAAKERGYDHPVFDEDLYHEFRTRGLSLNDFLGRQLQQLHGELPEVVDSGLALDLLAYHTTPLGTAEQRTMADLEQTYSHRLDVLPGLVQMCQDLYLLVDPARNQPSQPPASRLTHDTLAPHVRKRFDESEAPGQRARRILESRAVDWEGRNEGMALDDIDLAIVQSGSQGMRVRRETEAKLIGRSSTNQNRRRRARVMWRGLGVATMLIVLVVGIVAALGWQNARIERAQSRVKTLLNRSLTAQSDDGRTAVWLDLVALDIARQYDQQLAIETAGQLFRHTAHLAPSQVLTPTLNMAMFKITFSPDDRWLAVGTSRITSTIESHSVALWSLDQPHPQFSLVSHDGFVRDYSFSPDSQLLATAGDDYTVRIWRVSDNPQLLRMWRQEAAINAILFADDSNKVLFATVDGFIKQCSVKDDACSIVHEVTHDSIWRMAYHSPTGELAYGSGSGEIGVINLTQQTVRRVACHKGGVTGLAFHPQGDFLVSVGLDNAVMSWPLQDASPCIYVGEQDRPNRVRISPGGDLVATIGIASDPPAVQLWSIKGPDDVELEQNYSGDLCAEFSPDGTLVAFCDGSRVSLQPTGRTGDARVFHDHEKSVIGVAFSHDGKMLAGIDLGGQVIVWNLDLRGEQTPFVAYSTTDWRVSPISLAASPETNQAVATFSDGASILLTVAETGITTSSLQILSPTLLKYDAVGNLVWLTMDASANQGRIWSLTDSHPDPVLVSDFTLPPEARLLDFDPATGMVLATETLPDRQQRVILIREGTDGSLGGDQVEPISVVVQAVLNANFLDHEDLLASVTSGGAAIVQLDGEAFQSTTLEGCPTSLSQILLVTAFSSDRLILGTDGETICLWKMEHQPLKARLLSHMKAVPFTAISASQSGNSLAVAADKTLTVFEYNNIDNQWRVVGQYPGEWKDTRHMEFTQDHRYLLTATADSIVQFVPLDTKALISHVCIYLARQPPESQVETFLAGFENMQTSFKCSFSP